MEYQPRWIIYCNTIGKQPDDLTIKNHEYMAWINKNAIEYKQHCKISFISNQSDFTNWLRSNNE